MRVVAFLILPADTGAAGLVTFITSTESRTSAVTNKKFPDFATPLAPFRFNPSTNCHAAVGTAGLVTLIICTASETFDAT